MSADPKDIHNSDSEIQATAKELREGTVDFNYIIRPAMGSGGAQKIHVNEPVSGGSIVTWAELLRQQQQRQQASDAEVVLGSLPEIQIDSVSDKDIMKHLDRENRAALGSAQVRKVPTPPEVLVPAPEVPGALAAKLFQKPEPMEADWYQPVARPKTPSQSSIDLRTAAELSVRALSDADSTIEDPDESDMLANVLHADDDGSSVHLGKEPQITGLISGPNLMDGIPRFQPPIEPAASSSVIPGGRVAPAPRPARTLTAWVGGAAVCVSTLAGIGLGVWYGRKHAPSAPPVVVVKETAPPLAAAPVTPAPTLDVARKHLEAGDPEAALVAFSQLPDAPETFLGRGQARWFQYVRQQRLRKISPMDQDPAVAEARKDLARSGLPEGQLWLGLINETLGQFDHARSAYRIGLEQHGDKARVFHAALARLDAIRSRTIPVAAADPQLGMALHLILLQDNAAPEADEAGFDYWQAIELARLHKYSDARTALTRARAAHEERRSTILRQGLNPTSDPREDIFLHNCDQLLAFWDVQGKLHAEGYAREGRTPLQIVDDLLAAQKRLDGALQLVQAKLNTKSADEIAPALDALLAERRKAESALTQAEKRLQTLQGELATTLSNAQTMQQKSADDLKAVRAQAASDLAAIQNRAATDLKAARDKAAEDLKAVRAQLDAVAARELAARQALADAGTARKAGDELFVALAAKLRAAKLISSAEPKEVVAAIETLMTNDSARRAEIEKLKTQLSNLPAPVVATTTGRPDPERAERLFEAGRRLYFAQNFQRAESEIATALQHHEKDARFYYFRGLARLAQGKSDEARTDFERASELERLGFPDRSTVNLYFERIQGSERQAINRFRK